jgi:multisubunit Na+/H+ antiporter MnhB subunit
MMNLIVVLLMFVAIGAVIAIWTRDLLSAVIAMGVVGFTRTVMFVLLRAPDVAITQVVVEVLLLIILVRSAVRREVHTTVGARSVPGTAMAAAFVAVLLVLGVIAIRELPPFGQPVALDGLGEVTAAAPAAPGVPPPPAHTYIRDGLQETGSGNLVTGVLLDYRGYDTLGEATVLFTAVVAAIALLRRKGRRETDEGSGD